ncbi:MAG: sigma-54-dependent Fis family transcriptional regulator [Gemmatimonadetes bacterium]|nr:sigma-54-dependent Fis family transcriptional regulator [Gemmatimonadota bacterium]
MTELLTLTVVGPSDAFETWWPELAAGADLILDRAPDAASARPLGRAVAVVLSAAGTETKAVEATLALRAAGGPAPAVVGVEADHRLAVGVLQAGAAEYFCLPADLEVLRAWVQARADMARQEERAESAASAAAAQYDFSRLIGTSPDLGAALLRATRVIPRRDTTVLITGETGTGKELLAQAIHFNGPRANGPFMEVNCAALPATLLESELFGYEMGAFTDARAAKPGLMEAAQGGTLFLDEIGEIAVDLQVKLLKVLEDRRVRRLGGLRTIEVDIRIIAATHVDLPAAVKSGRFRQDLFYRLSVLPIHLPPLRERGEDVLRLAEHFLSAITAEYETPGLTLTREVRDALIAHDWPGNVRELRNAIERAVLLASDGLRIEDLFGEPTAPVPATGSLPFPAPLDVIERAAAQAMVRHFDGNKSAAAAALGISRMRLYRLLGAA